MRWVSIPGGLAAYCVFSRPASTLTILYSQMLSYENQLDFKRDVVVKAYKNFSGMYLH